MRFSRVMLNSISLTLLTMLAAPVCTGAAGANSQKLAPYKITAIKAMLFYDDQGTFSNDILSGSGIDLWNTIIGEGSAGGASTSTLIIVELSGKAEAYEPTRKIEFTATYKSSGQNSRPLVVKRTTETGIINNQGKFFAAFWLYDTGCIPVKLTARMIGQAQPSTLSKTIKFACGE